MVFLHAKCRYSSDETPLQPQKILFMTIDKEARYFSIDMDENHIFSTYLNINYILLSLLGSFSSLELQIYF